MSKCSLKSGGKRPKAWLGVVLSLASTAANMYNNYKNRKTETEINNANLAARNAELARQNELARATNEANNFNNYYATENQYKKNFENDLIYKKGGRLSLKNPSFKITSGGTAIPIDNHTFLLQGRSHSNGGINMTFGNNKNKVNINAQGGEIVEEQSPKSAMVYSNVLNLGNGLTPAKAVILGYNRKNIARTQQLLNGNHISTPVKESRNKAEVGDWINFGSDMATAIGTSLINNRYLKKYKTNLVTPEYYEETPVQLDTKYHNKAQLANLDRMRLASNKTIGENTANSNVAQLRMRNNNLEYGLKQNELLDYAANKESELKNIQAELNQGVRTRNTANRLQWSRDVANIKNEELGLKNSLQSMKSQNWTNMLAGMNRAGTNLYTAINQRKVDNNALSALIASGNPGSYKTAIMNGFNPGVDALINEYNREIGEDNFDNKYLYKIRGMIPKIYWRRLSSPNS